MLRLPTSIIPQIRPNGAFPSIWGMIWGKVLTAQASPVAQATGLACAVKTLPRRNECHQYGTV